MHSIVFLSFFSQSLMRLNLLVRIRNIKESKQSFVCVCVCAIRVYCVNPLMNESTVYSMPNCLCARISYKFFFTRNQHRFASWAYKANTYTFYWPQYICSRKIIVCIQFWLAKWLPVRECVRARMSVCPCVCLSVCPCIIFSFLLSTWRSEKSKSPL